MGVNSIQAQDLSRFLPAKAAQAPAPQLRTTDVTPNIAPHIKEPPAQDEGQVQRAPGPDIAPVIRQAGTRFRVDNASREVIAQVVDREGEVIRQIPPEEMIRIAAQFRKVQGMLFDEQT